MTDNIYPYCKANVDMYWPLFTGQSLNLVASECLSVTEYFDQAYIKVCRQTYPGFSSDAGKSFQTPTDTPLTSQYSMLE